MQSIFDATDRTLERAGLLVDGVISLARQWGLRPHFWEEPAMQATANGVPLFDSLGPSTPRTAALVYGAFLSAMVLQGVCWTMGYAWNHPRYMDIRPGHGPHGRVPEKFLRERPVYHAPRSTEPSLTTDQGRVLLIFNLHNAAATPSQGSGEEKKESKPATSVSIPSVNTSSSAPMIGVSLVSEELQSYTGSYVGTNPNRTRINVTMDAGHLQLEVAGEFRSELLLMAQPQRMGCNVADCWVAFSTGATGAVDGVEVHYRGREIHAVREQRGMVF
jgi:hypothetical protein